MLAAALLFLIGTVVLFATAALVRRSVPELGAIMSAPWWMWLGAPMRPLSSFPLT